MKYLILSALFFMLTSCGDSANYSGIVTYKYQITGVAPLAYLPNEIGEQIELLSSNFVLKWNEDGAGGLAGVYTNLSTGLTINVTGTSSGSGRVINGNFGSSISGATSIRFIILQTGDLSGSISTTLKTFDASNNEVSSQAVAVEATTSATTGGGGGGGGGGGTTMTSYRGRYSGTVTETIDAANKCNFVQANFRLVISNYDIMTYYTNYVDDDTLPYTTIVSDTSALTPETFDHTKVVGYSQAAGTTLGNGSKQITTRIQGVFATAGAARSFVGTLQISETAGGTDTCTYSLNLTRL